MIRPTSAAVLAALALGACDPRQEAAEATASPAVSASPAFAAAEAPEVLTPEGFGPIRIGQTLAEVEQAYGPPARPLADEGGCSLFRPLHAPEGVLVMMEQGRVSRVSLIRDAKARTDRDLGLGAASAEVTRAYGAQARSMPHKYLAPPAHYIIVWRGGPRGEAYVEDETARGLVYEVGLDGKVMAIHGGGPAIQYVEGCA